MKIPKTYKALLKLLIAIAENGNDFSGKLTRDEELQVGAMIADIQNSLGEMTELLDKLNLKFIA